MKKVFLGVGLYIFAMSMMVIACAGVAKATDWGEGVMTVLSKSVTTQGQTDGMYACMGLEQPIKVKIYGEKDTACVYGHGNQFRFARFLQYGSFKYAISYPHQDEFYEIRGVCSRPGCVYSSDSDVFIEHRYIGNNRHGATIHKNFSSKMLRQIEPLTLRQYYLLNTDDDLGAIVGYPNVPLPVEAMNLSNNGKWAILELPYYGIIRVDTASMDMRRVIAPGADYGLMNDPHYEIVITDDGRYIATTGYRASTGMYEIDSVCGDRLDESMGKYFASTVVHCKRMLADFYLLFPDMSYGFNLRFNSDGHRLGISILYRNGKMDRAILAPNNSYSVMNYLSLGDSFTSGEGELENKYYKAGSDDEKLKCHMSTRSYPFLVANRWGVQGESVACSGARTSDIYGKNEYEGQSGVLENLTITERDRLIKHSLDSFRSGVVRQSQFVSHYQPGVVSIGIGGNDAGLVGKLATCLSPGDCEWVSSKEKVMATAREISEVYPKIRELIRYLRQISPSTKFFTVGYPKIIDSTVDAPCSLLTKTLLSLKERIFINESLHYLNDVIKAASSAEKVRFVDVENSFNGHNLCGRESTSMMNGVRAGHDIALPFEALSFRIFGSESYHPTPKGHEAVADAILTTFDGAEELSDCTNCSNQSDLPVASDYWGVSEMTEHRRQVFDTSISKGVYELGEKIIIKTSSLLFMKNSEVVAELRSDPRVLVRGLVDEDGSFTSQSVIDNSIEPGYHTLHLLGLAPDSTEVDVYHTVTIRGKDVPALKSMLNTTNEPRVSSVDTRVASKIGGLHRKVKAETSEFLAKTLSVIGLKNTEVKSGLVESRGNTLSILIWVAIPLISLTLALLIYGYVKNKK